ncbi:MAG: hypothetical protein LBU42_09290 [Prevotellaceae bacterium]|nr:hypothetical protein [Prevotellaceae bacterium]
MKKNFFLLAGLLLLAAGCATQSSIGSLRSAVGSASFAAGSLQQAPTAPLAFRLPFIHNLSQYL